MDETEQLTRCHDPASGLRAVIAIDDTTLGPGLGGVRWLAYPDEQAAEDEARRLARVMTLKNACADLPYGGAKSVLVKDPVDRGDAAGGPAHRRDQLRAFGRFVDRLGGAYIPGVDMGTSVKDLAVIGKVAGEVSCDQEDPSPVDRPRRLRRDRSRPLVCRPRTGRRPRPRAGRWSRRRRPGQEVGPGRLSDLGGRRRCDPGWSRRPRCRWPTGRSGRGGSHPVRCAGPLCAGQGHRHLDRRRAPVPHRGRGRQRRAGLPRPGRRAGSIGASSTCPTS